MSQAPELIDVPWEYLFDDPDFLAVSAFTPIVRYLDLPRAYRPLLVEPPLRLLGVVSSPAEYEQLDVQRERDNLTRALSGLSEAGAIELHWLERPTLRELLRALQADPFHALHYIGHAMFDRDAEQGVLLFEDDSGWARPVSGEKLGMIVHDFSSLRLAVLNTCEGARTARTDPFAGVAGSLVQRDIPAVVAMQFEISDDAAIVFAEGFYRAIASGLPVDASLAAARLAMLAERSDDIEWGTPVLFMRVRDGRIFDFRKQPVLLRDDPAGAPTVVRRRLSSVLRQRMFTASPVGEDAGSRSRAAPAELPGAPDVDVPATAAPDEAGPAGAAKGDATAQVPAAPAPGPQPVREPPQRLAARLRSSTKRHHKRAGATSAAGDRRGDVGGEGPPRRYRWPALGLLLVAIAAVLAIIALISGGASTGQGQLFEAALNPVPTNRVTGSGTAILRLQGNLATVTVEVTGLLNGSPHLMHLHAFGWGTCPRAEEARLYKRHRVISATDGIPYYGRMVAALTETGDTTEKSMFAWTRYLSTGTFRYRRTIAVSAAVASAIRRNDAVILVHGIDYNGNGAYDYSSLGIDPLRTGLPQEATDPALCGPLYKLP